jgi:hypothetical protein
MCWLHSQRKVANIMISQVERASKPVCSQFLYDMSTWKSKLCKSSKANRSIKHQACWCSRESKHVYWSVTMVCSQVHINGNHNDIFSWVHISYHRCSCYNKTSEYVDYIELSLLPPSTIQPWRWKQYCPQWHWYLSRNPHSTTTRKTTQKFSLLLEPQKSSFEYL